MRKTVHALILIIMITLFASFASAQCPESYLFDSVKISTGRAIASAGDVNNDGFDDILIGSTSSGDYGKVYVHSGKTGLVLYTVDGDYSTGGYGHTVGGVGDINKDGYDDFVVVGASYYGAYLHSGLDGSKLMPLPYCDAIDGAGDVNNDGTPDIIIGNSTEKCSSGVYNPQAGRVMVISGADGSYLYDLWGLCSYSNSGATQFGKAVAGMGDLNDDGYDDFAIGAPKKDIYMNRWFYDHGEVIVVSGADGDTLHKWHAGMDFYDLYGFGNSIDNVGDVDGDGYNDIIIGHVGPINSIARKDSVWVFSGKYDSTFTEDTLIYTLSGLVTTSSYKFGTSVSAAGDVNLDGKPDFAVADEKRKLLYIFSGANGQQIDVRGSNHTGSMVAYAGDINGDGKGDVISAYLSPDPWYDTSFVYVYSCIFEEPECIVDADSDGDSYGDLCDNCPSVSNSNQADTDHDGIGDACDPCHDPDWDDLCATEDNCPNAPNPGQEDMDGDGVGDACDGCPEIYNPDQTDRDGDGYLDSCDVCPDYASRSQNDSDSDGLGDLCDNCQYVANPDQENRDGDKYGDACDNCPDLNHNQNQDYDGDGLGDPCDDCTDKDEDGFGMGWPYESCVKDNCYSVFNPSQSDIDGDGFGDECDNCPEVFNEWQEDWNSDGIGDSCVTNVPVSPGNDVNVDLGSGASITIGEVTNDINVEIVVTNEDDPPAGSAFTILPGGATIYHIDINWGTNPPYTICLDYDDFGMTPEDEAKVALWHYEYFYNPYYDSAWFNISTTLDTAANIVCGQTNSLSPFTVGIGSVITDIVELTDKDLPDKFIISQNYPNPFNPQTLIEYSVPTKSHVTIEIFNITGQKVKTLVDQPTDAGTYRVTWDGTDYKDDKVASGLYLYRLKTDSFVQTKKMMMIK